MPRGENPNSRENLKKGKPFDAETARKANKKSQEIKAVYRSLNEDLKERCTPERIQKFNERLMDMVEHGNLKAYELLRDGLGEKPAERLDIRDHSSEALDGYFQRTGENEIPPEE